MLLPYTIADSPIGPLALIATERGLMGLEFLKDGAGPRARKGEELARDDVRLAPYRRQLEEYFAGTRREFSFALDLRGTEFQIACWKALLQIPYGETRTYAEIARAIGRPQAFRAVGMANHDNPIAIVVPCHRVLASTGRLHGYGGGLNVKRFLLELEGAAVPQLIND